MKQALLREFPFSLKEQNQSDSFFSSPASVFLVEYNYEATTKSTFPDLKMNPVQKMQQTFLFKIKVTAFFSSLACIFLVE